MTADDILTALITGDPCPNWVSRAAIQVDPPKVYPGQVAHFYMTTGVIFFPEVTVRLPAEGLTRRGKPRLQRRRMDLVALVQPHYKNFKPFVIGVEIKVDLHDLQNDIKIVDYLGYCHLFYLAVPPELKEPARRMLSHSPLNRGGLLVVENSWVEVAVDPTPYEPASVELVDLYAELLLRPFKRAKAEHKIFVEFVPRSKP